MMHGKGKLFCSILLAGLLACGCASEQQEESGVAVSSYEAESSLETTDDSSADGTSDNSGSPSVGWVCVTDEVAFILPDGWTLVSEEDSEAVQVVSQDRSAAVQILRTELPTDVGMREQLLAEEAEQILRQTWEEAGLEQVESGIEAVSLAGVEHPAVLLQALSDGKLVCQRQVYVLDGKQLTTVTLSARSVKALDELMVFFHPFYIME